MTSSPTTHDVTVLGSLNLDVVIRVDRVPDAGETVLAAGRNRGAGGKGLNQAVAVARAGATTAMLGAVGTDETAAFLLDTAHSAGVDVSSVRHVTGPSGTAWVLVQADGDNAIVVDGAANATLESLSPTERETVRAGRVLVAQLEIPLTAVVEAAEEAHGAGVRVVLNAAPSRTLPADLLDLVDVLIVNEHEARDLSGAADPEVAATALLERAVAVVITLGAEGALLVDADGVRRAPGVAARVVDTTGAGDAFTGVLAAALAAGATLDDGCTRAVVAGSLAVETAGAIASIPTAAQVDVRVGRS